MKCNKNILENNKNKNLNAITKKKDLSPVIERLS